jgi:hypothetical protein
MFQLTREEAASLISQFAISKPMGRGDRPDTPVCVYRTERRDTLERPQQRAR